MKSKQPEPTIQVGVGIYVIKNGTHLLLQERIASHGSGVYAGAGGHMEYMESFTDTTLRELAEECGPQLKVTKPEFVCLMNLTEYAPKHYVHISMTCNWISGDPKVMEPDKTASWDWYPLDNLPQPLFASTVESLEALKTGKRFFE